AQNQRDLAEEVGSGIGWIQEMPYAKLSGYEGVREIYDMAEGAAGAGTYWLYAHDEGIHEEALNWARMAANRLLEVGEPAEGGTRWQLMPDIPWPFDAPNFAHGTAGVAYFMARMFESTDEQQYLDAALAGAGHVQAMAEDVEGGGQLVPHILNDGRPNRFYLGVCHGPPGTGRLFYLLSELTGDPTWRQWGRGLDDGLVATGAPEERGPGFWNNISQCCCDAGIGDHAVNMYRVTGDQFYLDLAVRVAKELIKRSDNSEGLCCWPQAEHRTQPDFIQTQTGYMQGAAGVASFIVHLATTLKDDPVKIQFPDSPFSRLD
ncbi:MAG: lantibiotic modifying enzyme, partial [Candidatus Azotimanducaceae bacterium]